METINRNPCSFLLKTSDEREWNVKLCDLFFFFVLKFALQYEVNVILMHFFMYNMRLMVVRCDTLLCVRVLRWIHNACYSWLVVCSTKFTQLSNTNIVVIFHFECEWHYFDGFMCCINWNHSSFYVFYYFFSLLRYIEIKAKNDKKKANLWTP